MMRFTDAQIEQAFSAVKPGIGYFIEEGLFARAILDIANKFQISSQAFPVFVELCRNALIGLVNPEAFSEELRLLGIPAQSIPPVSKAFYDDVVKKANEFTPPIYETLSTTSNERVETGSENVGQHMLPEGHHHDDQLSPDAVKPSAPAPTAVHLQPAPVKVAPTPPAPVTTRPEPVPQTPVQPLRPRTMASDVEAMQAGGKSEAKPFVKPQPPAPPPAMPVVKPPVSAAAANVHEDLKKYGVDPYREPVE